MKLAEYLDALQTHEREHILEIMVQLEAISDGWGRFCSNLHGEGQLSEKSWRSLLDCIALSAAKELDYQVTLHIRKNSVQYQLQGTPDPVGETECLTRLIPLAAFIDIVVDQDTDGMLPLQVDAFLKSEVVGKNPEFIPTWFLNLRLGLFILWAAIGLKVPNNWRDAVIAACRCGLPQEIEAGPIVCLCYRLPPSVRAHAPTILDAYGGWPWPAYFKAGSWNGAHYVGSTEPRADCAGESGFREVVSAPVPLSCLCEPVGLVEFAI